MENVNFITEVKTKSKAVFFGNSFYAGETIVLSRGKYAGISLQEIKSVKVAEFTRVAFYETVDRNGKRLFLDQDCNKLNLAFEPKAIVVETYVKAVKKNKEIERLPEGAYAAADIYRFDKLIIPRGFYVVFAENRADAHTFQIWENEEILLEKALDNYEKVLMFTLGNDDIRLNFGLKEELSDDELAAIAGGKKCKTVAKSCDCFCGVATESLN